jgi:hypothetical protein
MTTSSAQRSLRAPAALVGSLLAAVAGDRSAPAAVEMLRQAGFDSGEAVLALLRERFRDEFGRDGLRSLPAADFWDGFAGFCDESGWGQLRHRLVHPGVGELDGENWFESEAETSRLGCQFTTGLLASLLQHLAGEDVAVLESSCRGRGDTRCRFVFGAPETLDVVHRGLASGTGLDEALQDLR